MAGENARLLKTEHLTSCDWIANGDVAKGDVVEFGESIGIAMSAGSRGETVALCVECDLVEVPKDNKPFGVGKKVYMKIENGKYTAVSAKQGNHLAGVAHEAAGRSADTVRCVWRGYL